MSVKKFCKIEGCDAQRFARDLCRMHWGAALKNGEFVPMERPGYWGSIEKHPLHHAWRWISRKSGINGTIVAKEWLADPRLFFDHVGEKPGADYKLVRIDPLLGYIPGNLEWEEKVFKKRKDETSKEYARRYQKEYRLKRPENVRNTKLKKAYGISIDQFEALSAKQGHKCAICGSKETFVHVNGGKSSLAVDHCHTTGIIRGLLCHRCNTGLGCFKDSAKNLKKAIDYLQSKC